GRGRTVGMTTHTPLRGGGQVPRPRPPPPYPPLQRARLLPWPACPSVDQFHHRPHGGGGPMVIAQHGFHSGGWRNVRARPHRRSTPATPAGAGGGRAGQKALDGAV